jgi:hypothetical protein
VAAWVHVAAQTLRPAARRPETWRTRLALTLGFAVVGAWAAVAPQGSLSLGERLRLSFSALAVVWVGLAATSGLRRQSAIIADRDLHLNYGERALARMLSNCANSIPEMLVALPFFIFLAALQVISPNECFGIIAASALALIAAATVTDFGVAIVMILIVIVLAVTWGRNLFEIAVVILLALHLGLKAFIISGAIAATQRFRNNLQHEAVTAIESGEWTGIYRKRLLRQYRLPLIALACANFAFIALLIFRSSLPVTLEQRFALALASISGVVLLFIDASALAWRGLLCGITTKNVPQTFARLFGGIIGIPWAVGWAFSALHSGEATTLNETAAFFVLWMVLGGSVSWIAGTTAKNKLQRDFREIVSEQ